MFEKTKKFCDSFLELGVPGFDLAIYKSGQCIFRYMNGFSDFENKVPMNGTERYNIYSCSKVITCTAALQLWEKGLFSLEDKLSAYMPEFSDMTVKTDDGIRKAENPILIKHLFEMTAGFSYNCGSPEFKKSIAETQGKCPTRETMKYLAKEPLLFEPGDRWEYSLCHDVLAAFVEVISGEKFETYVKNNIFDVVGMNDSTFMLPEEQIDTIAEQYRFVNGELVNVGKHITSYKIGTEYASGGAGGISTVDDYIKFLEGLRTYKLLKPETLELMITHRLSENQERTYWAKNTHGYGLGVRCPRGDDRYIDFGWGGAASAFLAVDIENEISIYFGCHLLSSPAQGIRTLSIDQIRFIPAEEKGDFKETTWFERTIFSIKRFICSFSSEYGKLSSTVHKDAPSLKIWVNWGRDQTMVLNNLIQEDFVSKWGINVNLEITNATLVNGMLSGNAPDLSLHLARTEPVNLAMRGALCDLTEFDDYDEVIKSFGESASVPYKYGDGVYALPDTQSFYIMFYRYDILESLGLEVPETWEDFLAAVSVLQRNNMNAWLPYTQITAANTVNTGVGGLNMFASILQQFGGNIYDETLTKTSFESETTLKAFDFWTDMYTEYKMPTTATFYNRFRTGTMPLGIETYTTYTTLKEAAPEIEGRWGIALVPGMAKEDGTVDHTVAGAGTGCSILKSSKEKRAAWEFLKWWTSADTQLMYNNNVESIIGTVSRVTTANVEAFERMSWRRQDLKILLQQRENIKEIPEIPGSYYVSRSVDQSFWNVVNEHKVSKDTLQKWGKIADNEIKRKIAEYSESEAK